MPKAVAKAGESDVIIAVLGEDEYRTGESRSRTSLDLPGRQQQLLEALHATGKPVILVLINGQPLTVNWANAYIPAILESWFPGCQGGTVIAETLFGEHNPGGKLTVTFPKSVGQIELNLPFQTRFAWRSTAFRSKRFGRNTRHRRTVSVRFRSELYDFCLLRFGSLSVATAYAGRIYD